MIKPQKSSIFQLATTAGVATFALFAVQPALADDHQAEAAETELTKGEQRLARLLEGREAGEPQRCIRHRSTDRVTTIDGTAYVFGSGRTIYVQRTRDPEDISNHDTLFTRRFNGNQICRLDIVEKIDPTIGIFQGNVFYEDFIPYTRVTDSDG